MGNRLCTTNIRRADRSFEYFLIIATILQSILYQLFTWLLVSPSERHYAIALAADLFCPYFIALIAWIYVTLENISQRTIVLRLIAWSSAEAGITFNIIIFMVLLSLRPLEINPELGTWVLIGGILLFISFISVTNKILRMYEYSTRHYQIWRPRFGRRIFSDAYIVTSLVYTLMLIFLTMLLWTWTSP